MSSDKYPSIFLPQIEAIVFVTCILEIYFATCAILKIGAIHRSGGKYLTLATDTEVNKNS